MLYYRVKKLMAQGVVQQSNGTITRQLYIENLSCLNINEPSSTRARAREDVVDSSVLDIIQAGYNLSL